ncbi:MAG TPA: amidohydrolase [Solirubrobacterales bacterium]|nr:amidohydrolase [Solirubrobacterales bacterium]
MGVVLALAIVVLLSGDTKSSAANPGEPDRAFVNGRVMLFPDAKTKPMSSELGWAEAVTVTDGEITYVGDDAGARAKAGPSTEIIDLEGKTLMPSLGDGHNHAEPPLECDMGYEGGTVETVLGKIKECLLRAEEAGNLNSNFVLDGGHLMGEGMLPAGTQLTRHVLDRLSEDPADDPFGTGTTRPITIANMDHHKVYVNTKAIENAGLDENTETPPGAFIGRDPDGYPNGVFADYRGANWGPPAPADPDADYNGLVTNLGEINSVGITSIYRPFGDAAEAKRMADEGKLTVRFNQGVRAMSLRGKTNPAEIQGIINGFNEIRDEYDGYSNPASPGTVAVNTAKITCDGVAETPGQTAAMIQPYRKNIGTAENPHWVDTDWRGPPSCDNATPGFIALDKEKWGIHVHAIGDRATRVTLDNFEQMERVNPEWDRRPAITHLQFVDDADIPRFGELGVISSMSLQWNQRDAWSVDGIDGYIAPDRSDRMYPTKGLLDSGSVVAQGSDWTVTELVPWAAIEQAVTREGQVNPARAIYPGTMNIGDAITLEQAIKASTIGVAYQLRQDDISGSIETGKAADMIVVDKELIKLPGEVEAKLAEAKQALADATAAKADAAARVTRTAEIAKSAAAKSKSTATTAKKARTAQSKAKKRLKKAKASRKPAATKKKALKKAKKAVRKADGAAKRTGTAAAKARRAAAAARKAATDAVADSTRAVQDEVSAGSAVETAEANVESARTAHIKSISETKVLATMLNGEVVYTDPESPLPLSAE